MISFKAVSHAYGAMPSVEAIDLQVAAAETTMLIGPSGCGKSTLLRLATGLLWPSAGEIRIAGRELTRTQVLEVRRHFGYVIQSGGLFPHLTAHDNVTLMARHLGRDRAWIDARVNELGALVQLPADMLQRYPQQLSGGQRQRVSLMRALMLDPEVLMLDEPLGALDPMVRYELQAELKALFARLRKCVLMVSHDMAEAAFFSDHIVLMQAGRIVQQGTYEALRDTPATPFVSDFLRAQRALPGSHHA